MRAALLEEAGNKNAGRLSVVDDVEIIDPGPGQVRVQVTHCGICHSDLGVIDGEFPSAALPIVLGHEAAGIVESVGAEVTSHAPGDKVVLTPCPPCGVCHFCVRAESQLCVDTASIMTHSFADGTTGLSRRGQSVFRGFGVGGFGELAIADAHGAVKIAADIPTEIACVIGCAVQTGVGGVLNTARVEPGSSVLVLGLGGIGLSVVQGARIAGATRIIVSDPMPERREAAGRMGATHTLDPDTEDVVGRTQQITQGFGADYAFECVGSSALILAGIAATRPGGTTVMIGAVKFDDPLTLPLAAIFGIQEKKLIGCILGSCNSLRDVPRMLDLWQAGRLDLEALITSRRPLAEINDALDDLRQSKGIRTVVELA